MIYQFMSKKRLALAQTCIVTVHYRGGKYFAQVTTDLTRHTGFGVAQFPIAAVKAAIQQLEGPRAEVFPPPTPRDPAPYPDDHLCDHYWLIN